LWCTGSSFSLPPFSLKAEQIPFPGRIIVFNLQVHHGTDPGERVGKDPKQSAIAQARIAWRPRPRQEAFELRRRQMPGFSLGPRKSLGLDFPGRIHGQDFFFGEPGKEHPDGSHVLFDRGRRGQAPTGFDISGYHDGLDVLEVLVTGAISPGQELLHRPVVSDSCVRVADRDCKELEELFNIFIELLAGSASLL
jgi:hypothetical protein